MHRYWKTKKTFLLFCFLPLLAAFSQTCPNVGLIHNVSILFIKDYGTAGSANCQYGALFLFENCTSFEKLALLKSAIKHLLVAFHTPSSSSVMEE